jgi:glycosyltransferase involved in cell wall biosynthesis
VLFVGARNVYKNFFFFANAMRPLLAADPALHIVCTGSGFNRHEQAFFEIHGLTQRVHHHAASDAELKMLYQQAQVFVFPSQYEGFGLPVLEAFGNGCPTVLGNAGSLPEIGGDGALYFETKDARSLQTAMSEALYNAPRRAELIERGKARLALFSWDRTCRETEALYRALVG